MANREADPATKGDIIPYDTLKTAIHEFKNACTKDFVKDIYTISKAFRATMRGRIDGYIQHTDFDNVLEIACYSATQFECLAKTPIEARIVHLDSTGNLTAATDNSEIHKFVAYKRIMNHFLLVRNRNLIGEEKADKF
jgi:hypothetical protein